MEFEWILTFAILDLDFWKTPARSWVRCFPSWC